jgi:hypothetical protein
MKKITDWIYKNILIFSILLSLIAGVMQVIKTFYTNLFRNDVVYILELLNFHSFRLQYITGRTFRFYSFGEEGNRFVSGNYLDFIFVSIFIIGTVLFWLSKGKSSRLLMFSYAIICIASCTTLIGTLQALLFSSYEFNTSAFFILVPPYLITICISFLFLKKWTQERVPRKEDYFTDTQEQEDSKKFERAPWESRLANFILDTFLIVCIFSFYVFKGRHEWLQTIDDIFPDRMSGSVVFIIFATLYYLFFEGIFKTTPAKILTNSKVVMENDGDIAFSDVFLRTMYRRIPFNALSFLGTKGWHDSLSETTVVKLEKEPKKYRYFYRFLAIVVVATIILLFINEMLRH